MNNVVIYSLAFLITLVLICILKKSAVQLRLVDRPGDRKQHQGEIPLIGGIAMYLAIVFCSFFIKSPPYSYKVLLNCLFILVLFGALDDKLNISARVRLLIQILTVIAMCNVGHFYINDLGNLNGTGQIHLSHYFAISFTTFCVVGVINAFNMIDGLDGLAGGLSLIALLSFSFVAFTIGLPKHGMALLLLASIVTGFLAFNMRHPWRKKASVFMGDAGSTMLGFILAWFAIDLSQAASITHVQHALYPISAVWILSVPIMDALTVMTGRVLSGRSPFAAGRDHLHHILLNKGFKECAVVVIILAFSGVINLLGLVGWYYRIPETHLCYGLLTLFFIYFYLHMGYRQKTATFRQVESPLISES